jgi:anthranilate phosphoribosyltransferase
MVEIIKELMKGNALSSPVAEQAMSEIIEKRAEREQIGALLASFHFRTPTASELAGFARALRARMIRVELPSRRAEDFESVMDVCGTGGDGLQTFNISTAVAFVVAAAGQPVAKHGNRAVSSRCGSFDVLQTLDLPFAMTADEGAFSLARFKLAFLFAPSFHPLLSELAPVRKSLGVRTIFNVLGPLLNPVGVKRQLMGVYSRDLVVPVAEALGQLGTIEAMVVHGEDGSDELSLCAPTEIAHLHNGRVTTLRVTPEELGFQRAQPSDLRGGDPIENARILYRILSGQISGAPKDMVALNAGAALFVGGQTESLLDGIALAKQTLASRNALQLLERMRIKPQGMAV